MTAAVMHISPSANGIKLPINHYYKFRYYEGTITGGVVGKDYTINTKGNGIEWTERWLDYTSPNPGK